MIKPIRPQKIYPQWDTLYRNECLHYVQSCISKAFDKWVVHVRIYIFGAFCLHYRRIKCDEVAWAFDRIITVLTDMNWLTLQSRSTKATFCVLTTLVLTSFLFHNQSKQSYGNNMLFLNGKIIGLDFKSITKYKFLFKIDRRKYLLLSLLASNIDS